MIDIYKVNKFYISIYNEYFFYKMSVNISVSNLKNKECSDLLKVLLLKNINCRTINTNSIVGKNVEKGCLLTFDKEFQDKENVKRIWELIKTDYDCAHLQIPGLYNGCILNYVRESNCPGEITPN